jgi:hypothetical protein
MSKKSAAADVGYQPRENFDLPSSSSKSDSWHRWRPTEEDECDFGSAMWSSRRKAKRVQTGVTTIPGMDKMLSRRTELLQACEI